MKISVSFSVSFAVNNLGELREAVRKIDDAGLPDEYDVDLEWSSTEGSAFLYVYPYHAVDGELIACGDCDPVYGKSDILALTHSHEEVITSDKPDTGDVKPGWDWIRHLVLPEGDRFADEARPE